MLGVHPNTVRSWSDQGRLRYYRINDRGDRRYRVGDLQRFLTAAEQEAPPIPPRALGRDSLLRRRPMPIPSLALSRLDPSDASEELDLVAELAELAVRGGDLDPLLTEACRRIRMALGATLVGIWERTPEGLVVRASDLPEAPHAAPVAALPMSYGVLGRAIETGRPARTRGGDDGPLPIARLGVPEVAAPIATNDVAWGALLVAGGALGTPIIGDSLASVLGRTLAAAVTGARRTHETTQRLHRAEALRRVASDIGARLDLGDVLEDLVDHAMVLFGGDRAAVFLRRPDGTVAANVSRGLSTAYLETVRDVPDPARWARSPRANAARCSPWTTRTTRAAPASALRSSRKASTPSRSARCSTATSSWASSPSTTTGPIRGPRKSSRRCRPSRCTRSAAIRTARNYTRMATWTAQLQSIQQLGARLSRLSTVEEIGHAIATELRQLIDYHNVRVYRTVGDDLLPVAMLGQVGEYVDETPTSSASRSARASRAGWPSIASPSTCPIPRTIRAP